MGSSLVWTLFERLTIIHVLCVFGTATLVYLTIRIVNSIAKGIYANFLGQLLGHNTDLRKMGQWAVVTGATDGIGRQYASELGKLGINVVLISRNLEKLKKAAKEISDDYKVATRVIAVDFTKSLEIYDVIKKEIEDLEIGTLINNVGMSYSYPERLTEIKNSEKFISDIINCNCLSVAAMTNMVLPWMLKRDKGVIMNVSSISGLFPIAYMSLYAATKIFEDVFTVGVTEEYRDSNVIIQSVVPFYVSTNMSKIRKASFFVPTAQEYAAATLRRVGLEKRTYGCIPHNMIGYLTELTLMTFPKKWIVSWCSHAFKTSRDQYLENKRKYAKRQ